MSKKKIFTTKRFGELTTVTGKYLLENRDKILMSGSPILFRNKEGKLLLIPPKLIDKYIGQNESLNRIFFIKNNWETLIDDKSNNHIPHNNTINDPEKNIIQEKIKNFR